MHATPVVRAKAPGADLIWQIMHAPGALGPPERPILAAFIAHAVPARASGRVTRETAQRPSRVGRPPDRLFHRPGAQLVDQRRQPDEQVRDHLLLGRRQVLEERDPTRAHPRVLPGQHLTAGVG